MLSFYRSQKQINYQYVIDGVPLERVSSFVDPGVSFDRALSSNFHVDNIVKTSMRSLGFIMRLARDFTRVDTLKMLYFALISSKLEYASVVFTPYTKKQSDKINRVYRKFSKYMIWRIEGTFPPRGLSNSNICSRSGILPPHSRRCIASLFFLVKVLRGVIDFPGLLADVRLPDSGKNLRANNVFVVDNVSSKFAAASPVNSMLTLMNRVSRSSNLMDKLLNIYENITSNFLTKCI